MNSIDLWVGTKFIMPVIWIMRLTNQTSRAVGGYALWLSILFLTCSFWLGDTPKLVGQVWFLMAFHWTLAVVVALMFLYMTVALGRNIEAFTSTLSTGWRTVFIGFTMLDLLALVTLRASWVTPVLFLMLLHDYANIMDLPKPPKRKKRAARPAAPKVVRVSSR